MKKLLIILFLFVSASSFANNGKLKFKKQSVKTIKAQKNKIALLKSVGLMLFIN